MLAEKLRAGLGLKRAGEHRHAVIDIGSNTVRLVIFGGPPRAPAVLWNERVSARLGRDLARSGAIPPAAMDEALAALARFAILVRELGIVRVETIATAAAREASNGAAFIARVEAIGLAVRVLSGEEEAQASAWGAIGAFPGADGVVADLGGGSLELVTVGGGACGDGVSLPLGTLRLPALRSSGDFDRKVAKQIAGVGAGVRIRKPAALYMVGGTWRAFATYAMRSSDHPLTDPHGFVLATDAAAKLAATVADAKPSQLAKIPGISAMRAETLPDAAALLRSLLVELRPQQLVFSSWGLREGLYFRSLADRDKAEDPLLAGVTDFTRSCLTGPDQPAQFMRWAAAAAPHDVATQEHLRLAGTHLAMALHCAEPNLRGAYALEWALDKRWVGIDFAGRAMLAAMLRGSLGLTEPEPRLRALASDADLRRATAWGLAFRLARRFGGGTSTPLSASRLVKDAGGIELTVARSHAALVATPVEKALATLAAWLNLDARLTIVD